MFSSLTKTKILGIIAAVIAFLGLVYAAIQKFEVPEAPVAPEVPAVEAPVVEAPPVVAPVVVPVSEENPTPAAVLPVVEPVPAPPAPTK